LKKSNANGIALFPGLLTLLRFKNKKAVFQAEMNARKLLLT
jgi:hypothetical protein